MSLTAAEPEKQITKLTKAEVIFFMTNKKIYCVSHSYPTKKKPTFDNYQQRRLVSATVCWC